MCRPWPSRASPASRSATGSGLLAPAATPAPVIARIAAAAADAVNQPALRPRLDALGLQPAAEGPETFARFLAAERAQFEALIREEGIRLDS